MPNMDREYTPAEHELTQILVTELLAHQFCSPVQWIDTQDVLLKDFKSERIVEVGPAETLVNMAKKTLKADYAVHDAALGLGRDLLSYKKNADGIYYKVDEAADEPEPEAQVAAKEAVAAPTPPAAAPQAVPVAAPAAAAAVSLPDKPLTPLDVLLTLVCVALKKAPSDISTDSSIKKLCGGRSTVQNEIVGDLTKEFAGALPDGAEDVPLAELSAALASSGTTPTTKLGACASAYVAKLASAKMPAGLGVSQLRALLASRFGLAGQGLQDRVLLLAVATQPAARLAGQPQVEQWLAGLVDSALRAAGIDPATTAASQQQAHAAGPTSGGAATAVSSEALDALQAAQREQDRALLEVYRARVGEAATSGGDSSHKEALDKLQARVDALTAEVGDEFAAGVVAAKFDARMARRYDSFWNWAVQDLLELFAARISGRGEKTAKKAGKSSHKAAADVLDDVQRFGLRATPQLLGVVSHLRRSLDDKYPASARRDATAAWLDRVQSACEAAGTDASTPAPRFRHAVLSTVPVLRVAESGALSVGEVPRQTAAVVVAELEEDAPPPFSLDDDSRPGRRVLPHQALLGSPGLLARSSSMFSSGSSVLSSAPMSRSPSAARSTSSSSSSVSSAGTPPGSPLTVPSTGLPSRAASTYGGDALAPAAGNTASDSPSPLHAPAVKTKPHGASAFQVSPQLTARYASWFGRAATSGVSLSSARVLVTGAGRGSIARELVAYLLACGAKVCVATSSSYADPATTGELRDLYVRCGARGSELAVVPYNGASAADAGALVKYLYDDAAKDGGAAGGLGWHDVTHVVPFAAMPAGGHVLSGALGDGGRAELAHRILLTNVLRLLGAIRAQKAARGLNTSPTRVLLPLSPNHGAFGGDALYAEAKLGLEAVLDKWHSEDWGGSAGAGDYLSLVGVVIGWTRGTGLMKANDVLACGMEAELGLRTWGAREMAWHLLAVMDDGEGADEDGDEDVVGPDAETQPLVLDLGGGLAELGTGLKAALDDVQSAVDAQVAVKKALCKERKREADEVQIVITPPETSSAAAASAQGLGLGLGLSSHPFTPGLPRQPKPAPRARIHVSATPSSLLPSYASFAHLHPELAGMADLDRVPVIVGFGEVGPYGSARTRWEAETAGTFSLAGAVELAWIMGLVRYHNGPLTPAQAKALPGGGGGGPGPRHYAGWLDVETNLPMTDVEIKATHEARILAHTGIRVLEPRPHDDGLAADAQSFLHEVAISADLAPFEASQEAAREFVRVHGEDKVAVSQDAAADEGNVLVTIRKGATLLVPRAAKFRNGVAAQLPSGWDAARTYGIPDEIIKQVDTVTLYALVSTVECLLSAGVVDPSEMFAPRSSDSNTPSTTPSGWGLHVSELGNCVGASLGGITSLHRMFRDRWLDRSGVQTDVLAETFVNTTAAWLNMLLLGGAGPIRTPVGACATSLESVDAGYDLVASGRARAVLVGGTDGYERETAAEFANMRATIDAEADRAAGRRPAEASRPTASSRKGFVESEGCGVQLMTTARLAIDLGLPVHAVVALTHTASDGLGRSVPAPGKGVLTAAAEAKSDHPNPLLDLSYRRELLQRRLSELEARRDAELAALPDSADTDQRAAIEAEFAAGVKALQRTYGNDFWRTLSSDNTISPLRGALATWGLTGDSLGVASLHGTSTVLNDLNETAVLQRQLEQLDRTPGNVLPCVAQKSLLGHGKGAAGAFALNGCLQMLASGVVPGNRNADNVDGKLADRQLLHFPSRTMQVGGGDGIDAFSVTSFGFGQKGAQVVGVHPRFLFAGMEEREYERYSGVVRERMARADRRFREGLFGGRLVQLREAESGLAKAEIERRLLVKN